MNKIKELYHKTADNPLLGLIPLGVFVLVNYRHDFSTSLLVGFPTSFVVLLLIIASIEKGKIHSSLFLMVSNATLFVAAGLYFIPFFEKLFLSFQSVLIIETVFAFNLFLTILFKKRIQLFFIKIAKLNIGLLMSNSIDEFVYVSKIILYALVIHLTVAGLRFLLPIPINPLFDVIFIWALPSIFIVLLFLFEYFRMNYLKKKLAAEKWPAIVDEQGRVIGKIAKSETLKMGNKYLHPMVRIAVAHAGRLFLAPRSEMLFEPESIDHPFEEYVEYEHTLDETTENILKANNIQNLQTRFSIKYLFENEKTRRLIYLYTVENCDDNIFNRQKFENGKFWTQKQIEENLSKGVFSECFEKEYDFLKNTLLLFCSSE